MIARRLLGCVLFFLAVESQAAGAPARLSSLEEAGFKMTSAARLAYEPLTIALQDIESRTSLRARVDSGDLTPSVAVNGDILIVELNDSERFWETTFLFYHRDNDQVLFLRLRSSAADPEVRLWSQGPSEVIISNQGARWQPSPSADTFRFDRSSALPGEKISAADALSCLAKILGLSTTNWSSAISLLTNLSCAQRTTFEAVQTLLHCFSIASVGVADFTSTAGCVLGVGQLIACGYLTCAAPPIVPSGLSASDGTYTDRVRVSWSPADGASNYTLYRSDSSGSIGSSLTTTGGTSYDDTTAVSGYKYYYYRVKACNTLGCSAISGYDSGWRATSSSACSGSSYTGSLSAGNGALQPNGSYYQSYASGTHTGQLSGPAGSNFDLYLYRWNGSSWGLIAQSVTASSSETLSYSGSPGYYTWQVYARSGSGSYTLCLKHP